MVIIIPFAWQIHFHVHAIWAIVSIYRKSAESHRSLAAAIVQVQLTDARLFSMQKGDISHESFITISYATIGNTYIRAN